MNQLPRQLELNLTALSRSFRQALRYALKTDPQGTAETSPAWQIVAERQVMLLTTLTVVGQFLHGQLPPPLTPPPQPALAPAPVMVEAFNETAPPAPVPVAPTIPEEVQVQRRPEPTDEELLATIPPDMLRLREKIIAVQQWPTNNFREKKRQATELKRLQGIMGHRYNQWQADLAREAQAQRGLAPCAS